MRLEAATSQTDMSHHSDDGMLGNPGTGFETLTRGSPFGSMEWFSSSSGSDSFWEPGNYKRTTKRVEDGEKLCQDLILLVKERANIEKEYSKQLKTWSNKWETIIQKGPEYGTTEAAWKSVLVEADRRCELHIKVKDNLLNEVVNSIKNWQKDNYHRQMLQLKEKKDMEDQFKKAQKPWSKLLEKVEKCKVNYHIACKNEKTAVNQERNATKDSSLSQDQVRKLQDKVSKCQEAVKKSKENYELALLDITNYNSRYQEDMTDVFERCQRKEAQRLQTIKDTMFSIHKCLNIAEDPGLPQIYDEFYHTVNNADHDKDLRWWSNTHGVNMPMAWPQFEEYNVKPVKTVTNGAARPATLPNSNHNSGYSTEQADSNGRERESNPFDDGDGEEEWDDAGSALVDTGEKGLPVRALYHYEAAEPDELTFKSGDELEKLEDEDEQGWCKGRKDGRVGLYPANYVEPV